MKLPQCLRLLIIEFLEGMIAYDNIQIYFAKVNIKLLTYLNNKSFNESGKFLNFLNVAKRIDNLNEKYNGLQLLSCFCVINICIQKHYINSVS